jgi:hypothetical protein
MQKMNKVSVFAIFPYLRTSHPVIIRNIQFRSSNDLEGLSPDQQTHLKNLFSMFFLRDDLHITQMVYTCLEFGDNLEKNDNLIPWLYESQILINYLYSIPHHSSGIPIMSSEDANLYIFQSKRFFSSNIWPSDPYSDSRIENLAKDSRPSDQYVDGYEGLLNGRSYLWVIAGNRIYPPLPHFWLNVSQDLWHSIESFSRERHNWALVDLITGSENKNTEVEERIFTALKWHNRSTTIDVSEDVALLNLAIAFECLLNLEQNQKVTDRFSETVRILLGFVPRLDSWLEQFYKARSDIVHKGTSRKLMFYAVDLPHLKESNKGSNKETAIEYRTLTTYGRRIFRLCLNAILSGAKIAETSDLQSLFIHNKERLEKICQQLRQSTEKPEKRLRSVSKDIHDLVEYRGGSAQHVKLETVIGAGKLILQTYLDTNPQLPEDVAMPMRTILQQNASPIEEKLKRYEQLATTMRSQQNNFPNRSRFEQEDPFHIVWSFIEYVNYIGIMTASID